MTVFHSLTRALCIASLLLGGVKMTSLNAAEATTNQPPVAEKRLWQETRHGEVVTDDYRWLQQKIIPKSSLT